MADVQWSAAQSLAYIPDGKLVTFTAMHQAEYTQYVQIIDANNQPISFYCLDGSQATFPISGSGVNVGFLQNGAGRFTMASGMQVQFGSSGPNVPKVSAGTPVVFFINKIFGGGTLYVTEDGTDNDYNDTSFVIQWYQYVG
ncbi:fucose-binding lectin II family protein [Lysobacter capsici]|jgi:hypothetical protein|uniref:hypothetical protein n=1 Tax=Lysobacter capsici TaxID=435897 RepID=UPI000627F044|nr:hypothetical protein [Lysobacter capsici]ALN88144.1 fucose-binding lectin II family protein [Lysobacter capsici]WND80056.1 hypothetical protein RJ610_22705 [Lysobacter capsici]WND85252.1 hypothetical protein RJ609_22720 [Lysobacter capsici]